MPDSITPPPELVTSLRNSAPHDIRDAGVTRELWLINSAYAAGADQELEACVNWLADPCAVDMPSLAKDLRYSRRPKAPTLKEQALEVFEALIHGDANGLDVGVIRRALEALND
jgi:hypothetical protein